MVTTERSTAKTMTIRSDGKCFKPFRWGGIAARLWCSEKGSWGSLLVENENEAAPGKAANHSVDVPAQ